jgi:hypothetical protein
MNEEPKSIWKSPLKGWRKVLAWGALLATLSFVVACFLTVNLECKLPIFELLAMAIMLAVPGTLLGLLAIWFIRWLRCWRNLLRFLIGIACLITLIALAYVEENWRGKHAWEAHKRQWEAKGEKFTLAQLVPPPVPDDQNFAMTPLLKPLLDYTRGSNGVVWRDTNGLARVEGISGELENRGKTNSLVLGILEKGTFADVAACVAFYRGHTNYPQPAVPGTAAADILVALGKFDPEIKELREAAATCLYSRFPVEYQYEPSWAILLRHLAPVKRLCLVTHVRALTHLELGQSAEALEELKLGLRLSDSIRDEPILISHLVRVAATHFNLQILREGLVRHAWNDAQLAELEKYLASLNLLAEYKLGMRGERVFSTSGLDWLRRQGFRVDTSIFTDMGEEEPGFAKVMAFMPSGWYYQNIRKISEIHQELILPSVDENAHRVFPNIAEKADSEASMLAERPTPYNLFAGKLMPALSSATRKSARMQTFVDAARVACALERYRLANGKLPETLNALTPRFTDSIPTDVIDGQPLRYKLKPDGGYVVYSVGWNKTDDGGEIGWEKSSDSKAPRVDFTKGDWVWQMPDKQARETSDIQH